MKLVINAMTVSYGQRLAVRDTSLALESGSLVALVGPNGAGKSSLLKAIVGIVPRSGTLALGDRALDGGGGLERARLMAYLPQAPLAHWPMRVRDLVALGRLPHRSFAASLSAADRDAIDWAMRATDIEALADRAVDELSGGEHARAQLARAFAVRAPVLLIDEPVASLDPYHQLTIMRVLAEYAARDALVLTVMHDLTLAARFAARTIVMHEGAVVADGPPAEVLDDTTLRRYYRVEPLLGQSDGQPLIVPWRTLD